VAVPARQQARKPAEYLPSATLPPLPLWGRGLGGGAARRQAPTYNVSRTISRAAQLNGYRVAPDAAALEALMTRVEARLLGGHHLHLTHHRFKRRAVHPLIRDVRPDAYGRIDFRRLWLGDARESAVRCGA